MQIKQFHIMLEKAARSSVSYIAIENNHFDMFSHFHTSPGQM